MIMSIDRKEVTISRGSGGIQRAAVKISREKLPSINELFEEGDNPLEDVELGGDLETEVNAEYDAAVASVRAGRKEYAEYVRFTNDTKFYCCLVFQSEEQKLDFLHKANLIETADYNNFDNMYLNGLEVARRMGLDVPAIEFPGGKDYKLRGKPSFYRKEVIP